MTSASSSLKSQRPRMQCGKGAKIDFKLNYQCENLYEMMFLSCCLQLYSIFSSIDVDSSSLQFEEA